MLARLMWAGAALILLILPAAAYTVTIVIEGYNNSTNSALLSVNGTEQYVNSGSQISLPGGNYTFRLFALNKTFEKDVEVNGNTTVVFDLRFTNKTDNITLTRHIIVYGGREVMEVLMVRNAGMNFEGDLTVALPDHSAFAVTESTLSFVGVKVNGKATFRDVIVPKNGSGTITYTYRLKSNILAFNDTKHRILLLTSIPVSNVTGLEFKGIEEFKGKRFEVYEGYADHCRVVFSSEGDITISPIILVGILALSAALFLYFRTRSQRIGSGKWKL